MTKEDYEALRELAYTNRYYINTGWANPDQQSEAYKCATAMIEKIIGHALKPELDERPTAPIAPVVPSAPVKPEIPVITPPQSYTPPK